MGLQISTTNSSLQFERLDEIVLDLKQAKDFEEAGEFNNARELLEPYWRQSAKTRTDGLSEPVKAEATSSSRNAHWMDGKCQTSSGSSGGRERFDQRECLYSPTTWTDREVCGSDRRPCDLLLA